MRNWPGKLLFLALLSLWLACVLAHAQADIDDPIGFGDIKLRSPVRELPITCLRPFVCEDTYDSVWVRVWHAYAVVQQVDVIYAGRESNTGAEIRSSPLTLAQAIRTHSIRNGSKTPRLGFAGNEGPSRMVMDYANGICYLAAAVAESSPVTEVHYVPMTDPLVQKASALPLYERGAWLVRAALLSPRYKNLVADAEASAPKRPGEPTPSADRQLAARFTDGLRK